MKKNSVEQEGFLNDSTEGAFSTNTEGGFLSDGPTDFAEEDANKRKKKGKIIAAIVAVVLLVGAIVAAPFVLQKIGDAKAEEGNYKTASTLYSMTFGLLDGGKRQAAAEAILAVKDGKTESGIALALAKDVDVSIKYDLNGGHFINSARKEEVLLQEEGDFVDFYKATKEYYEFLGWSAEYTSYVPGMDDALISLSLKAEFAPIEYAISYTNLYSDTQENPTSYTYESKTITLKNPTRIGYTFASWKGSDIRGETGTVVIPQGSSGDRAYIANWTPNQYTVEFVPDVECNIEKVMTVTYDDEYIFPEIEKRGYTYRGWSDGSNTYTTGLWVLTNGISVVPVWDLNTYTLTYDLAGGALATANKANYTVLDEEIVINNPTRFGYKFLGWTYEGQTRAQTNVVIPAHSIGNYNFKANWAGNPHTITLDLQGGTAPQKVVNVIFGNAYTIPTPTRTGYTFGGWFNGNTQYTKGTWNQDNDLKVTAKWTANKYRVTFDSAGGTAAEAKTATFDQNFTLPTTTRTGYEFRGWYRWNTKYESGIWKTPNDVPLTATWRAKNYTVKLDPAGGTSPSNSVTVTYDQAFTLPTPTKKGHTFLGWYKGSERHWMTGTWKQDSGTSLVANWEANKYSVTLDTNGGSLNTTKYTFTYGKPYSLGTPTRTGYNFDGWIVGNKEIPTSGTYTYDHDLFLEADWTGKKYTVTMDANGGFLTDNTLIVVYGSKYKLSTPLREGYDFLGWYRGSSKFDSSDIWSIDGNVSVTAQWEASEYTVKLDANGGRVSDNRIDVTYTQRYSLPTPTRDGYDFVGWYKSTTKFDSSGYWEYADDVTLKAKWRAKTYYIDLNPEGGSVSTRRLTVEYDEKFVLPTPSRTGFLFLGWYTSSGKKVVSGTYETTGNMTLYAEWEYIPVTSPDISFSN